jgi:hypothetical protein
MFKGVTILLVVSIHVLYKFHGADKPIVLELFNYVTGFAVPLFLILGGYFFFKKVERISNGGHLIETFKKLCSRIILPYYISVLLLVFFRMIIGRPVSPWPLFFLYDANTHGLYFILIYIYAYVFTATLFYILSVLIKFNTKFVLVIMVPCLSLLFFPFSGYLMEAFPNNFVVGALPYISFFVAGFPICELCERIALLSSIKKTMIFTFIVILGCLYTITLYVVRLNFGHFRIITSHPPTLYFLIYSVLCFLMFYFIIIEAGFLSVVGKTMLINRLGEESLFVFLIHPYFVYLLPSLFNSLFENMIANNLFLLPWAISTYVISILTLYIYKVMPLPVKSIFSR